MGIWVSTPSAARRHGAYAIERSSPPRVRAIGTGVAALVAQLPWGPDGVIVTPAGSKDLIYTFAPPGMDHLGAGFLAFAGKGWPTLKLVRVLGAGAAASSAALSTFVNVAAKYRGTAGNSLVATVSNATNGNPNHFRLTVSVSGASGATVDVFDNLNFSGTGADSVPYLGRAFLVGAIVKAAAGRPANGSYTFSGGLDGTLNALAYTGTAGAGLGGIAALEGDSGVRHVVADDPGNTLRPSVNAALRQHADAMGDRVAYVNGPTGQSLGAVGSDVANFRGTRVVYVDPWVYVLDETGAKRLVPPASFAASVAAQVSPSTSIAWKDIEVVSMLSSIVDTEFDRGNGAADNSDQGVVTVIREENGGFSFEAGVVTAAPLDPSKRNLTRTRIGDYAAVSMVRSSRSFIDAPNVPANHQGVITMVSAFMEKLVAGKESDPNHTPHCLSYAIPELAEFNSDSDIEDGNLTIPVDMRTSSGIERLFYSIRYGESVKVRAN